MVERCKVTTREEMRRLRKGNEFFVGNQRHIAGEDSHPSGDSTYDGYIVYDEDGNGWFEDDFEEERKPLPVEYQDLPWS